MQLSAAQLIEFAQHLAQSLEKPVCMTMQLVLQSMSGLPKHWRPHVLAASPVFIESPAMA